MSEVKFDIEYMPDKESRKFEKRSVNIVEALNNVMEQLKVMISMRYANPISLMAVIFFNKNVDLGPLCATVK